MTTMTVKASLKLPNQTRTVL